MDGTVLVCGNENCGQGRRWEEQGGHGRAEGKGWAVMGCLRTRWKPEEDA